MTPYTLEEMRAYLSTGLMPSYLSKNERRSMRKLSKDFFIRGTNLYKGLKKVLLTENEKEHAFRDVHGSNRGAHMGRNRTISKLSTRFYFFNITSYVHSAIQNCDKCQRTESIKTVSEALHPIKSSEPWEVLGMDLIGPFNETKAGNKYCLTITDLFSKWVEAYPIKSKSAGDVATCLLSLFFRFGPPKRVITDQGREFVNSLNAYIFETVETKHLIASAYHPQTNGQDERTNRTIKTALSKLVNENQDDWDSLLEPILFGIRTSRQGSTKFTPFQAMLCREPRFFSEIDENDVNLETHGANDEIVLERIEKIKTVYQTISANIDIAQEKQKKEHLKKQNKHCKSFQFKTGQKVLKKNNRKKDRKGQGLETDWLGPYEIMSINNYSAVLKNKKGEISKTKTSLIHLKPYQCGPLNGKSEDKIDQAVKRTCDIETNVESSNVSNPKRRKKIQKLTLNDKSEENQKLNSIDNKTTIITNDNTNEKNVATNIETFDKTDPKRRKNGPKLILINNSVENESTGSIHKMETNNESNDVRSHKRRKKDPKLILLSDSEDSEKTNLTDNKISKMENTEKGGKHETHDENDHKRRKKSPKLILINNSVENENKDSIDTITTIHKKDNYNETKMEASNNETNNEKDHKRRKQIPKLIIINKSVENENNDSIDTTTTTHKKDNTNETKMEASNNKTNNEKDHKKSPTLILINNSVEKENNDTIDNKTTIQKKDNLDEKKVETNNETYNKSYPKRRIDNSVKVENSKYIVNTTIIQRKESSDKKKMEINNNLQHIVDKSLKLESTDQFDKFDSNNKNEESKKNSKEKKNIGVICCNLYSQETIKHGWLTDMEIDNAQRLLSEQNHDIESLQSVLVLKAAEYGGYIMSVSCGTYVQIINVSDNHWITFSGNATNNEVNIYDSLGLHSTPVLNFVIAAILYTNHNRIELKYQECLQQAGYSDCGLFAIANATSICHGEDPSTYVWDQTKMRDHLIRCFTNRKLTLFPYIRRTRQGKVKHTQYVCLCSFCRLPESRSMVKCNNCHQRFHIGCVVLTRENKHSICNMCFVDIDTE